MGCRLADRGLEILSGLPEPRGPDATILLPWGFRVVEVKPRLIPRKGWSLYLVRKFMTSTEKAIAILKSKLSCRLASYSGVKDACSVSWQHVSLYRCKHKSKKISMARVKAWKIGDSLYVYPGGHGGNIFKIWLDARGDCPASAPINIPGFYGVQRFGVLRPNSHAYSYWLAKGDLPSLLEEYKYRYPLEERPYPGLYERAAIEAFRRSLKAVPFRRHPIVVEALRSYLFNKALSTALERGVSLESLAESYAETYCGVRSVRVPAARLPTSAMLKSNSGLWASIVSEVVESEGLDPSILPPKGPLRPLVYPVCRFKCRRTPEGIHIVAMHLPPGAYATVALSRVYTISWIDSYSMCG